MNSVCLSRTKWAQVGCTENFLLRGPNISGAALDLAQAYTRLGRAWSLLRFFMMGAPATPSHSS